MNPSALWPVIQRSLRVLLIAPAYSAAFAAMAFDPGMAFKPGSELSLLDRFVFSWNRLRLRLRRLGTRVKRGNAAYLQKIGVNHEQD